MGVCRATEFFSQNPRDSRFSGGDANTDGRRSAPTQTFAHTRARFAFCALTPGLHVLLFGGRSAAPSWSWWSSRSRSGMSIYAPWVRPVGASLSACPSACPSTCMSVCLSVCHPPVVACRCDLQRPASSPARSRPTWRACPALADCSTLCYICDCIVGWHLHQLRHPVLHLRLHRGLALQVVRDRLQRVHDGHHTCHKFANVSTCPLECEFEPGYSGDGYMMCNNISCRWSDDALNPAFESRTWPIRAGGSPGPSITVQRFPRSAPPLIWHLG